MEEFIPDTNPTPTTTTESTRPNRVPLKLLLISSPEVVKSEIRRLYCLGYAKVDEWSPLQPTNNPGEVMSVLRRQILVN